MSGSSSETAVLLVDPRPLRSLGLVAFLGRLFEGSSCRVESVSSPEDAEKLMGANLSFRMIIYNIGGASVADHQHRKRIRTLMALGPPIVIFSDNDSRDESFLALTIGVRGFLHMGTGAELARQALTFIFQGGTHFPQFAKSPPRNPKYAKLIGSSTGDLRTAPQAGGMPDRAPGAASSINLLTDRQRSVLKSLQHGDSNKAIARELGIGEGTVKVHVRQIMHKLGVRTRTKIAIACPTDPALKTSQENGNDTIDKP